MSASKPAKKIPPSPVEIVQQENPILRKKARELALSEIASPKIQKIIEDMIKELRDSKSEDKPKKSAVKATAKSGK